MREGIHPDYVDCKVSCSCGNVFETKATVSEIKLAICSACHPFYTGTQKLVDSQGRVERFKRRYEKVSAKKTSKKK